ncbi:MAG: hypothetical protein K8S22_09665 [Betaproteobacteria bacterium]|nr:hypothetical protein [Betaproteobacteria bacterium]
MIEVRRYRQADGFEPLTDWLKRLPDRQAKARLFARIDRLETGNFGDCKFLRDGVSELRIDQSLFHQYPRVRRRSFPPSSRRTTAAICRYCKEGRHRNGRKWPRPEGLPPEKPITALLVLAIE